MNDAANIAREVRPRFVRRSVVVFLVVLACLGSHAEEPAQETTARRAFGDLLQTVRKFGDHDPEARYEASQRLVPFEAFCREIVLELAKSKQVGDRLLATEMIPGLSTETARQVAMSLLADSSQEVRDSVLVEVDSRHLAALSPFLAERMPREESRDFVSLVVFYAFTKGVPLPLKTILSLEEREVAGKVPTGLLARYHSTFLSGEGFRFLVRCLGNNTSTFRHQTLPGSAGPWRVRDEAALGLLRYLSAGVRVRNNFELVWEVSRRDEEIGRLEAKLAEDPAPEISGDRYAAMVRNPDLDLDRRLQAAGNVFCVIDAPPSDPSALVLPALGSPLEPRLISEMLANCPAGRAGLPTEAYQALIAGGERSIVWCTLSVLRHIPDDPTTKAVRAAVHTQCWSEDSQQRASARGALLVCGSDHGAVLLLAEVASEGAGFAEEVSSFLGAMHPAFNRTRIDLVESGVQLTARSYEEVLALRYLIAAQAKRAAACDFCREHRNALLKGIERISFAEE